jgi:dipeptidyl aminopeptidase/acylaminoacyl peptidase
MMNRGARLRALAACAALMAAPGVTAQDPNREAALFGALEGVEQMSLSPDGASIAVVAGAPAGPGNMLMVGQVGGAGLKPILRASGSPERLSQCRWSTDTRLVCEFGAVLDRKDALLGYSRVVAVDADGSKVKLLTAPTPERALSDTQYGGAPIDWLGDQAGGKVLMTRAYGEQMTTGNLAASSKVGLAVERVDVTTLKRSPVEQPERDASEYITDGRGVVRVRGLTPATNTGYAGDTVHYQYRNAGSHEWRDLSRYAFMRGSGGDGFEPYAVDPTLDVVYGFDKHQGRRALFRIALDGSLRRELVTAHPEVDVDGLVRIGRDGRVVGVSYAADVRRTEFFDPELKRLRTSLSKALPASPLISFIDASADEKKLLLWAGGDVDPGRYYLYDRETRRLGPLLAVRPQLADVKLAPVRPVTYKAADGAAIPGYLTLPIGGTKGLPAIVLPHGGPGTRDEWGFDWLAQFFAARGYAVLQPNFRGSAGYGDRWFQKNGFQSWRTAVGDVADGGRWLVAEGIADPAKLAAVGWSYGGYASLQSAVIEPSLFKAVVAVAPVTDLEALREQHRRYASFALVDTMIGTGPHVREGSPAQNAARIKAPVLLFHGSLDQNVGIGASRLMASKLRGAGGRVELVEFPGLQHGLIDATARTRMLAQTDAFLRRSMGMTP